ncbi:hypothetical protein ACFX13_018832 [Malus domestica]
MPARPKFEEELIKNVSGEAKKAQRKRFRLWCLEKLEALMNLIWIRAMYRLNMDRAEVGFTHTGVQIHHLMSPWVHLVVVGNIQAPRLSGPS